MKLARKPTVPLLAAVLLSVVMGSLACQRDFESCSSAHRGPSKILASYNTDPGVTPGAIGSAGLIDVRIDDCGKVTGFLSDDPFVQPKKFSIIGYLHDSDNGQVDFNVVDTDYIFSGNIRPTGKGTGTGKWRNSGSEFGKWAEIPGQRTG